MVWACARNKSFSRWTGKQTKGVFTDVRICSVSHSLLRMGEIESVLSLLFIILFDESTLF